MTRVADGSKTGTILVIDDEYANLRTLTDMLESEGYDVRGAINWETASMIIGSDPPDLILLDIKLPGISGYEICSHLKEDKETADIPVAFLSVLDDVDGKLEGFRRGGVDFISKPFHAEEVLARVDTHLKVSRLTKSQAEEVEKQTEEIRQRLAFEELILEISTSFSNASSASIDSLLNNGLEKLGKFVRADRCGLVRRVDLSEEFPVSHLWMAPDLPDDETLPMPDAEEKRINLLFPWVTEQIANQKTLAFESFENLPQEAHALKEWALSIGLRSLLLLPLVVNEETRGFLGIDAFRTDIKWTEEKIQRLRIMGGSLINAVLRIESQSKLEEAFKKEKLLKTKLQQENIYLRTEIDKRINSDQIIGESPAIKRTLTEAQQVATENTSVLVLGDTGTGKELLAQFIHDMSPRKDRVMIKVNCAALPANLIESELFGREKGAYTGAMTRQQGRFEQADGSTIFLDEIGDLPLELQSKLLRVLQEGSFEMLGSTKTITVDARIIAATNRDLKRLVKDGHFRRDLYYRVNVFPITVPPLAERRDDIPLLAYAFVEEFNRSMGKSITKIHDDDIKALKTTEWPGNVRELRNIIERSMILSSGSTLQLKMSRMDALPDDSLLSTKGLTLAELERSHILRTLESADWRVSGKGGTAEILGLKPTTLEARMKKLNIRRPT